mmetsp:Transcript_9081/g.18558  ORF Transcript_9081/g.18558 Transcript_9081/m.18558 type:complete len:576 (-) Transcript_9081:587-2314(-)
MNLHGVTVSLVALLVGNHRHIIAGVAAFQRALPNATPYSAIHVHVVRPAQRRQIHLSASDSPLNYDDEDFFHDDDEDAAAIARATSTTLEGSYAARDLSGSDVRLFRLGYDLILDTYAGSMGFDEVTDWDYYTQDEDGNRNSVEPTPFDASQPKRTRSSSGSVVRIFRGELSGKLGNTLRARGMDKRVLVKEFSGKIAKDLASAELKSVGRLQSEVCARGNDDARNGDWAASAATRYLSGKTGVSTSDDDACVTKLLSILGVGRSNSKDAAPFVGILGRLDLYDFEEDMNPQEWYSALKVGPPKPDSIWVVYEYVGLTTLDAYARPPLARLDSLPPQRNFFGSVVAPPPLPQWRERANYVVKGIMQQSLQALAFMHENGIAHRSIGRNSIILSSVSQDKMEASTPYALVPSRLVVKLADFGFGGPISEASMDEEFRSRAKSFGIIVAEGSSSVAITNFAMAEDLHALGFVFLGLLLTSLAEIPTPQYSMPATDEDSLQRLLTEIFDKDFDEFREYVAAEDIWTNLVSLLDENEGAGWDLLKSLCFARERAAENKDGFSVLSARALLASPIFSSRR